jgi:RNA polymerase subunit RPABC4/transcription elongation factor Spt4
VHVLVSWPGGSLEATLKLVAALAIAYVVVLWISAVVWVYRDIRLRTRDPFSQAVAVILVGVFNVPGLVVYLVIRPQETLADVYERSLEAESILHELQGDPNSCQTCRRPIEPDYTICPHCRTTLREPCRSCGRAIRTNWQACPYCTADRLVPVAPPRPAPQQRPQPQATQERAPAPATPSTAHAELQPRRQATPEPEADPQEPLQPPPRQRSNSSARSASQRPPVAP